MSTVDSARLTRGTRDRVGDPGMGHQMNFSKIGAVFFVLWGLLHIIGGAAILLAATESPAAGYAAYGEHTDTYTDLAGSVLAYLAYGFIWIAVLVTYIGIRYNWRNSPLGLALNTVLIGMTDLGLVLFLILPGFVSWAEASPGLLLFIGGAVFGGIACNSAHDSSSTMLSET